MKNAHSILLATSLLGGLLFSAACNSGALRSNPGKTYAPDMTYSRAYESYTYNPNFSDNETNRMPVEGTVPMGHELPDHLLASDTVSYMTMTTDLRFSQAELDEGKRLYDIYCGICHGGNLDGQGPLYTSGKFAAAPANFKDAKYLNMSIGQMYRAIKFGKNMMGAYASQLETKQRWQVIAYIKKVQSENGGDAFTLGTSDVVTSAAPETAAANTDTTAKQ